MKLKHLLEDAMELPESKKEEVVEVVECYLEELDDEDRHELKKRLDFIVYGYSFTKEQAEYCVSEMENEDGTYGEHWTLAQTNSVASSKGLDFSKEDYNEYDFYYVMNMMYSDYHGIAEKLTSDSQKITEFYYELAMDFLDDKDAPKGKAKRYMYAMKH